MRTLRRDQYDHLQLRSPGMEYASEMIVRAHECGLRYSEVKISFRKDARGAAPHLKRWRDGWRHLRYIFGCAPEKISIFTPLFLGFSLNIAAFLLSFPSLSSNTLHFHSALIFQCAGMVLNVIALSSFAMAALRHFGGVQKYASIIFYDRWSYDSKPFYISSLFFLIGFMCFAIVFVDWLEADFGPLSQLTHVIRGVVLIQTGLIIFLADLLFGMVKMAVLVRD